MAMSAWNAASWPIRSLCDSALVHPGQELVQRLEDVRLDPRGRHRRSRWLEDPAHRDELEREAGLHELDRRGHPFEQQLRAEGT